MQHNISRATYSHQMNTQAAYLELVREIANIMQKNRGGKQLDEHWKLLYGKIGEYSS